MRLKTALVPAGLLIVLFALHGEQLSLYADSFADSAQQVKVELPDEEQTNKTLVPPPWDVDGEERKQGAGLLFFAYGEPKTLSHFLAEASTAAATFRRHNPAIPIAVVSNNATVDWSLFDLHIRPRADLLFMGSRARKDRISRQWLTRLYYLALSPFYITWALDSNVVTCTPGAAQAFLDAAMQTDLWGYHIAHGSMLQKRHMYPHTWNVAYRWDETTSVLMREWLTLQLRQVGWRMRLCGVRVVASSLKNGYSSGVGLVSTARKRPGGRVCNDRE